MTRLAIPHLTYQADPPPRSLCLSLHHKRVGLFTKVGNGLPFVAILQVSKQKQHFLKNNDSFQFSLVMILSLALDESFLSSVNTSITQEMCALVLTAFGTS